MTKEEGLKAIDKAEWYKDGFNYLFLEVPGQNDFKCIAVLSLRPHYCDRGHIQFNMEQSNFDLDGADSFPRFFFSFEEADHHVRTFLKWRIWKHRTYKHELRPDLKVKEEVG